MPRNEVEKNKVREISYVSVVESLIYTQICTCPNINFMVGTLGRF